MVSSMYLNKPCTVSFAWPFVVEIFRYSPFSRITGSCISSVCVFPDVRSLNLISALVFLGVNPYCPCWLAVSAVPWYALHNTLSLGSYFTKFVALFATSALAIYTTPPSSIVI